MRRIKYIALIIAAGSTFCINAQEINKQVEVTKAYEPIVADAFKINHLPVINDTVKLKPYFNYVVAKRPVSTQFQIQPISAAKMVGEPISRLYRGYARAGFGNYITPMAELSFTDLRSDKHSWGIYMGNHSSFGDITLADDSKVSNTFSHSAFNLYGKYFLKNAVFSANAYYKHDYYTYYGYDTAIDTAAQFAGGNQGFNTIGADLEFKSTHIDSSHVNYRANLDYHYFFDAFDFKEHKVLFDGKIDKYWGKELVAIDVMTKYFNRDAFSDTSSNLQIGLNPNLSSYNKRWRVNIGVDFILDGFNSEFETRLYPQLNIQYDIINQYFIPYIEVDGHLETNNYAKMAAENPYILPGQTFRNTNHKLVLGGGVKGNFSKNFYYHFSYNYSLIDDMYFFKNDFSSPDKGKFIVEYDNIRLMKMYGQLTFKPMNKLDFELNGSYYQYNMGNPNIEPWHKPDFEANFITHYQFKNKLLFELNVFAVGTRYYKPDAGAIAEKIEPLIDANLGVEYKFTKMFSAFGRFNNIAAQKSQLWYLYPMHRFNFMLGVNYTF